MKHFSLRLFKHLFILKTEDTQCNDARKFVQSTFPNIERMIRSKLNMTKNEETSYLFFFIQWKELLQVINNLQFAGK